MSPFRVFGIVARPRRVTVVASVLFWNCASFRVFVLTKYRPYGLGVPTLPLAVSSALWFFLIWLVRLPFKVIGRILSSSSTFL